MPAYMLVIKDHMGPRVKFYSNYDDASDARETWSHGGVAELYERVMTDWGECYEYIQQ